MITGRDLMVQLVLMADFKRQVLQWYVTTVPTKQPSGLLGKSDLSKRKIREVVMQNVEPDYTREDTDRLFKILGINYKKSDLKQVVDKATQLNAEEITQLLRLLGYFKNLFDGTFGYC